MSRLIAVMLRKTMMAAAVGVLSLGTAQGADILQVFDRAQQQDAELRAAEAQFRGVLENRQLARSALLPQVSGEGQAGLFYNDTDGRPSQDGGRWSLGLNLDQLVFDRRRTIEIDQTELRILAASSELEATRQDLILRVAQAYFDILIAQETLQFRRAEVEAINRQLDQTQRRFEVGLIAITDVREAQAQSDLATAEALAAENELDLARERLSVIANERYGELAGLAEDFSPDLPDPADPQQWVDAALENNLMLIARRKQVDVAREQIGLQRAEGLPTLGLGASVTRSGFTGTSGGAGIPGNTTGGQGAGSSFADATDAQVGLQLRIPIYTGGRVSGLTRQAREEFDAALENLELQQRRTVQETRSAYLSVLSNRSRVEALAQALISTRAAFDAAQAGFEVGTRTQVDVLLGLREVFRAERDLIEARYFYLLETLRLASAVGGLDRSHLERINAMLEPGR